MQAARLNPISFEEMVAYVKNLGKITYQEVMEENVLQLHCDYSCLQKEEDYRTAMNFRLVADKKTSQQILWQDHEKCCS